MSSNVQNKSLFQEAWVHCKEPVAYAAAIVPPFYGFMVKSAQQLEAPIPKMRVFEVLKAGCKAAPTIGCIVGTQMEVQKVAEESFKKVFSKIKEDEPSFQMMLASSVVVGAISAPALAVFNGQTMGKSVVESLRGLSLKQASAIVTRETSFLFSLRVSGPLSGVMKQSFGENKTVEYVSAFTSGAIGSIVGHPADTALTRWQNELKVTSLKASMRGAPTKALAIGSFSVCYKGVSELMKSLS